MILRLLAGWAVASIVISPIVGRRLRAARPWRWDVEVDIAALPTTEEGLGPDAETLSPDDHGTL